MNIMYSQKKITDDKHKDTIFKIYNRPYPLKYNYNSIIPLKIFQTWYTKDLPPAMKERVEYLKESHPKFEHFLFDDNECRKFIQDNFNSDVLNAYDSLIPGAYKADLWRYCVLYIHGGIYMDIKLRCINGFKLIELTEANHYVKDRLPPLSIYNALIASQPGNPLLWKAICRIVINVHKKFYGKNALEPTGPVMLGKIILKNKLIPTIDLTHYQDGGYIIYKNRFIISTEYPEYTNERSNLYNSINTKRYDYLWVERKIYK
jgi:mannosyltransferase OCH1-like enzyme